VVAVLALLVGCSSCKDVATSRPGSAVIDCTIADASALGELAHAFAPLLAGERPDWSAISSLAKSAGAQIGGCALAELVQSYLTERRAVPLEAGHAARDALESFRASVAGGATFHTVGGDL
jgi:hypothetical protein